MDWAAGDDLLPSGHHGVQESRLSACSSFMQERALQQRLDLHLGIICGCGIYQCGDAPPH
jgi:hypothetical protein